MSRHQYVAASREQHGSSLKHSGERGTAVERCPRLRRSSSTSCQRPYSYPSSAAALNPPPPHVPRLVSPGELHLAMGRMLDPRSHPAPSKLSSAPSLQAGEMVAAGRQLSRCTRLAPKCAVQDAAMAACTDTKLRLARAFSGAQVSLSRYLCVGTGAFLSILGTHPASKYPLPEAVSVHADTS